jgi:selenide,water dikinase
VLKNGGAQAGDRLLLTKSLGTGVISTAIKKGVAKQSWIDAAIASMTTLNKTAAEVMTGNRVGTGIHAGLAREGPTTTGTNPHSSKTADSGASDFEVDDGRRTTNDGFPVHALTDITGFGLIGHLREMLLASENVSATIHAEHIPLLAGALDCVRAGYIPGGLKANREFAECMVRYEDGVPDDLKTMLFDPQTAGGLLISIANEHSKNLSYALNAAGVPAVEIGEILPKNHHLLTVSK